MNFFKVAQGVDFIPLLLEIHRQPELWKADTYLRDYPQGPFSDVETIFCRFPESSATELERSQKDQHECINREGLIALPSARKIIFDLAARVQAERIGRVMINKIRPGGRIFPHADTPAHADYYDRFHVCLQSTPGCVFRCGDEKVYMAPGEVWHFRNEYEHEVQNNGSVDRIHMIVDLRTSYFG